MPLMTDFPGTMKAEPFVTMLRTPDIAVPFVRVNVALPDPEAVPVIAPVPAFRLAHEGRFPLETVQVPARHPD